MNNTNSRVGKIYSTPTKTTTPTKQPNQIVNAIFTAVQQLKNLQQR